MLDAVSRHGYGATTLRELVTLAGVSKSTFYEHFESKQECFLATFDDIVDQITLRVGNAYREPDDFRERLVAGLGTFMQLAVDAPAAATLVAIDSLTLGTPGVAHRERASRNFELLIQQSFDHSPSSHQVSPVAVRAIVAGIRGVAYQHLREGRGEELPATVDRLIDWILCYQREESDQVHRAAEAASVPYVAPLTAEPDEEDAPGWDEPPDGERSRAMLSQRTRIVRGAARVVVEHGYERLSIPAISGAAGVSNQTFYEHFASKQDAFLAAFEILAAEALETTTTAYRTAGDRVEAIGIAIRALLQYIAANQLFAQLAFFELPTAGPTALDRADAVLASFGAFLRPETAPGEIDGTTCPLLLEAIPAGIWGAIQHEIHEGRLASLPELAPELTRIALVPVSEGGIAAQP